MSELPDPITEGLEDPVDEAAVHRMWRGIQARRTGRALPRGTSPMRVAIGLTACAAAAVVVVAIARRPSNPNANANTNAGALTATSGSAFAGVLAAPIDRAAARDVQLSDGSRITLQPGARVETLENDGHSVMLHQSAGRVHYAVRPGGPRRWVIECGIATVEVVGTRFAIDRSARGVHVDVDHGIVLVRGERVPERVRRLVAGQALDVPADAQVALASQTAATPSAPSVPLAAAADAPAAANSPALEPPAPVAVSVPTTARAVPRATTPRHARGPWLASARDGHWDEAYRLLGADGIERESRAATVSDLLILSNIARETGHPEDAVHPLRRVVEEHPRDPAAPVAAITLGRTEMDSLHHPTRAASAFALALALGVPSELAEGTWARLTEARWRAGDVAGARAAMHEYLRRYPSGEHVQAVRRWGGATP